MQNQKGIASIIYVIIIIALLAVAGFFGYKYYSKSQTPISNSQNFETAGWKTYTNEKFKYSLKYPNDWQVWEANPILGLVILFPSSKSEELRNKTISTTDEITLGILDEKYIDKAQTQEININNQKWFFKNYSGPFDGGTENGLEYFAQISDGEYISIATGQSKKVILSQILSTFKFTK